MVFSCGGGPDDSPGFAGRHQHRARAGITRAVLKLFPGVLRVNGRLVLVGDGVKVAKQGKKMPAVKLLHQESESNTKAEYIMGGCVAKLAGPTRQYILAYPKYPVSDKI